LLTTKTIFRILSALLLLGALASAHALENQLAGHPSPYLAMHGDDPVAWQDWGIEAVELAREENKLLFISSGYFSCHWCHVMQRESYQDPEIAALLNKRFVPVKLDRELHGALDGYLIDFLEQTQGQAGWPLNVFLTPEGYPLIGATYLPPERFHELLIRLDASWLDERGRLRNLARRTLLQLMLEDSATTVEPLPPAVLFESLARQALMLGDPLEGGFGDQNKFPMAPQLQALLTLQEAVPHSELGGFLALTLDQMADEGLRDHLAGGFFRYTVDPSWQVPHFEKMLYTQAQLIDIYLRGARVLGRPDFADIAYDTLAFVLREMRTAKGAYVSSFSAVDGSGEEGGAYLWTVDELHDLLGEQDTALARRHWRMLDLPAFDGAHLPRRGESAAEIAAFADQDVEVLNQRLGIIRQKLLDARATRELPVDGKVLAGWNGLMLGALSDAAMISGDPRLHIAARELRDYLRNVLWTGSELLRAVAQGEPLGRASLADYAYVADGMSRYAALSGDPADRTFVAVLVRQGWQRFHGVSGWLNDDQPLIPGMAQKPALLEGALPAPSAVLIAAAAGSGDPEMMQMAVQAAELGRAKAQSEPFWYAGHLLALLPAAATD
jgi:uncharacterized protein YyaL (SSP411 family)